MKKITYILWVLVAVACSSCSDFFDSDSKSLIKADGQMFQDELETRSGLFGLLQGLQKIGDNYVLMGELRGDLMTTTDNSSQELRDINESNIESSNSYLQEREYYELLNNCNYYIQHLDTAVTKLENGVSTKFMLPYMAQAKAIRAWTYLQLCLDYGKVNYTTQPILKSDEKTTQVYTLDELLPVLITDIEGALDLLPKEAVGSTESAIGYSDPGFTNSVTYNSYMARQLMLPLHFVLGELYLWKQDFAKAAEAYYYLIYNDRLKMCANRNTYSENGLTVASKNWANQFSGFNYPEILTGIVFSTDNYQVTSRLYDMANKNYTIAPSLALINTFDEQNYYTNRAISGDLRGLYGTYTQKTIVGKSEGMENAYITKYNSMKAGSNYYVAPCRSALIYLRYAEALNRLGKCKFVFNGFLKYGLSAYSLNLYKDIIGDEMTGESWMNFGQDDPEGELASHFSANNRGFHARGCGNTDMNDAYKLEAQANLSDSIEWVEEQLVNEYALETALEGNRFHDLMRISRYRNNPSYLAQKVAAKFTGSKKTAVYTKLQDMSNWYLPE